MNLTTNENGVKYGVSAPAGRLHTIAQLKKRTPVPDSHAGETGSSTLMLNRREMYEPRVGEIAGGHPYYPRVKKLANGKYLMTFNNGPQGPYVFYRIGESLSEWGPSQVLFAERPGKYEGHTRRYAAADAVVLQNGTVLVAATFWENGCYGSDLETAGTVLIRSEDNGLTWSDEEIIYPGISWEPCLLQLRSGEVQCYITHIAPYCYWYGYHPKLRSSGSAIMRSFDNGKTWTPRVTGAPYEAHRVMQTYLGMRDGVKIFNDQMPVAVELNNGDIACVCETRHLNDAFRTSLGVSHDNWAKPLGPTEAGPDDKFVFEPVLNSYGPYIRQMPSGETVVSMSAGGLTLFLGDETAHNFRTFGRVDHAGRSAVGWDSLELLSSHSIMTVSGYRHSTDPSLDALFLNTYYLNHRIDAENKTVNVDGDSSDWEEMTDALFVGARSQAQASVRVAHDSENYYFLIERLDNLLSKEGDDVSLLLSADGGKQVYRLTVTADGRATLEKKAEDGVHYEEVKDSGLVAAVAVYGTLDNDEDTDEGYLAEVALPKKALSSDESGKLLLDVLLNNTDRGVKSRVDEMFPEALWDIRKAGTVLLK